MVILVIFLIHKVVEKNTKKVTKKNNNSIEIVEKDTSKKNKNKNKNQNSNTSSNSSSNSSVTIVDSLDSGNTNNGTQEIDAPDTANFGIISVFIGVFTITYALYYVYRKSQLLND
jgi:amino acid permease